MKHTARIILPILLLLCLCSCENKSQDTEKYPRNYLAGITIISVLILIHTNAYLDYLKQKNSQDKMYTDQIKAIKKEAYRENNQIIKENKKKIEELEQKLQNINQTNITLKAQLQKQKQIILYTNKQVGMELNEQEQAEANFFNSEIYIRFKKDINTPKNNSDWQTLQKAVDKTYNNFTENLCKFHNFSNYELQVCLLIKINIQPSDMAKLTNHTKEAITAIRRRLYEKVFHEKGTPHLWDDFIHAL